MNALEISEYPRIEPLLTGLDCHLALRSILEGNTPARIYVDRRDAPEAALVLTRYRFYLAGVSGNIEFNQDLQRLFNDTIYPQAIKEGKQVFVLFYSSKSWEQAVDLILQDKQPILDYRQYYGFKDFPVDRRTLLPPGFSLYPVDRNLLKNEHLKNLDDLQDEMCSERSSVEDFLEKSFGLCLVCGDEIAGWCLSEYNCQAGCEIGIETRPNYRKRGLATLMTLAFVEMAQAHGINHIGWDCWKENIPSSATAKKAGFYLAHDYPVYLTFYKPESAPQV